MSGVAKQDAAMELAWKLYVAKVQEILNHQFSSWKDGDPTGAMSMTPPSVTVLNLIQAALQAATDDGVEKTLWPIVAAIDEIDNGGKKSADTKRHYEKLNEVLAEIRAMKSTNLAVAK